MTDGTATRWRIVPRDELETFLLGCMVMLLALLAALAAVLLARGGGPDEIDARSRVLSLARELSQVAKGDRPIEAASNPARPFGFLDLGLRPMPRTVAISGEIVGGVLEVEVHTMTKAECRQVGRMLKSGENPTGIFDGVSVNGSEFADAGRFTPEACLPNTTVRGGSGGGLPRNVMGIRIAAPRSSE